MSFLLYRAEQAKKIMILLINYTLKAFIKIVSDSNYVKPCATVNYIITRIKNHRCLTNGFTCEVQNVKSQT